MTMSNGIAAPAAKVAAEVSAAWHGPRRRYFGYSQFVTRVRTQSILGH